MEGLEKFKKAFEAFAKNYVIVAVFVLSLLSSCGGCVAKSSDSNHVGNDTASSISDYVDSDTVLSVSNSIDNDTALFVSHETINGVPFILLRMNRDVAYATMADSVIPDRNDSTIFLCVEAAFTGKLLNVFKSTNVAGDYVIEGKKKKGYDCSVNTGYLLATADGDVRIGENSDSVHLENMMQAAQQEQGSLFQQKLLIHRNKVVVDEIWQYNKSNIYRAACKTPDDADFIVIQSESALLFQDFVKALLQMGISEALYLDMGQGWNYGWYRQTTGSPAINFFDYKSQYQTNWLVIRQKNHDYKSCETH